MSVSTLNNKNCGLAVYPSRVKGYLQTRQPAFRYSKDYIFDVSIFVNFMISQLCYNTVKRMDAKNKARKGQPAVTLTREELAGTVKQYSIFADLGRKAQPVGSLPVYNRVQMPSAEKLKAMTPSERQHFFRKFNYKDALFDENYFSELRLAEKAADEEEARQKRADLEKEGIASEEEEEEESEGEDVWSSGEELEESSEEEEEEEEESSSAVEDSSDEEPVKAAAGRGQTKRTRGKQSDSVTEPAAKRTRNK